MDFGHKNSDTMDRDDLPYQFPSYGVLYILQIVQFAFNVTTHLWRDSRIVGSLCPFQYASLYFPYKVCNVMNLFILINHLRDCKYAIL